MTDFWQTLPRAAILYRVESGRGAGPECHLAGLTISMTEKKKTPRKSTARKPNRAQQKAAEVRAAETRADVQQAIETGTLETEPVKTTARTRARQRKVQQPAQRVSHLSRAQEYAFIRSDFRRLLITAGTLLALMLVVLFVVEA